MLTGLDASKDQELLSYLLIHRDRPHSREALASLLWADTSTEKSKKYLRQALWHLHAALNSDNGNGTEVLLVDHDWLSLNPCSNLWTDVADFERAFAGAEGVAGRQLDAEKAHALKDAVSLYSDDLLPGYYQDWILFERERLQNMYLLMLDKLMGHCEARADYEAGQHYGDLVLRHDLSDSERERVRTRSRNYQQFLRLLAALELAESLRARVLLD